MGVRWLWMLGLWCYVSTTVWAAGSSVQLIATTVQNIPVKIIRVNMNDENVKVTGMLAKQQRGRTEPLESMVARARPTAAVTGTFFGTRSYLPVGDIVIEGRMVHFGGIGTALCITPDNQVEFVDVQRNRREDWSAYNFVIRSGPRLVRAGRIGVYPRAEGFRDRNLLRPAWRLAVGLTRENHLLFVGTRKPITLRQMALVMHRLGCVDAINLDAGSSTGMYYRGQILMRPLRRLTNLVLVYENREQFEQRKYSILPLRIRR
ncbi:MAG: phosphodiester glycosidase family protein [Firmicutes bacterium]|nr:phosphodiester glycosidase family protein [Bacillota bacterium]